MTCPACHQRPLLQGRCGTVMDSCGYNAASFPEEAGWRLRIVHLPGEKWMVVVTGPPIHDPNNSDATARHWSDWLLGRDQLFQAGASAVLRFTGEVEIEQIWMDGTL